MRKLEDMVDWKADINKADFLHFCEVAKSNSPRGDRKAFLKNLSEQLCKHFDLPVYMPGQTDNDAMMENFYKQDIVQIIEKRWAEPFDLDKLIEFYLETM